jgi:hypothetical protein
MLDFLKFGAGPRAPARARIGGPGGREAASSSPARGDGVSQPSEYLTNSIAAVERENAYVLVFIEYRRAGTLFAYVYIAQAI